MREKMKKLWSGRRGRTKGEGEENHSFPFMDTYSHFLHTLTLSHTKKVGGCVA